MPKQIYGAAIMELRHEYNYLERLLKNNDLVKIRNQIGVVEDSLYAVKFNSTKKGISPMVLPDLETIFETSESECSKVLIDARIRLQQSLRVC